MEDTNIQNSPYKITTEHVYAHETQKPKAEKPQKVQTAKLQPTQITSDIYVITGYCPCSICCGQYAYNRPLDENGNPIVYGASGNQLVSGYSCAAALPFGTLIEIEGLGTFRVDDRGVPYGHVDLYFDSHEAACSVGCRSAAVRIIGG